MTQRRPTSGSGGGSISCLVVMLSRRMLADFMHVGLLDCTVNIQALQTHPRELHSGLDYGKTGLKTKRCESSEKEKLRLKSIKCRS